MSHKTGKGHSDFSEPEPIYVEPANGVRWQKPVVVLTNRHSYSATNDFVNSMRYMPHATIIGDQTGGGSGMPFNSEVGVFASVPALCLTQRCSRLSLALIPI